MPTTRRPSLIPGNLFQSPPVRPTWRNLPPDVRERTLELLIQLLRELPDLRADARPGKEAGDE